MSNAYRSVLEAAGVTPTGNALPADVLDGKTFSNANGVGLTGAMINRGAISQTISPGGSYTIPAGYHNGSGRVSASNAGPIQMIKSQTVNTPGASGNVDFLTDLDLPVGTHNLLLVQFVVNSSTTLSNITMTNAVINSISTVEKTHGTDQVMIYELNVTVTAPTQTMSGSWSQAASRALTSRLYKNV